MDLLQPKGMRDFSPEEKIQRDKVIGILVEQFSRFGFNPIETPIMERWEVLSAKYAGGAEILKETFRLTDQGERELGLRYDLTVPLARYVAINPNVKFPFKRYAIGQVYRDGPIKLGRYREFYQCDCDIVGASSASSDAQCLQLGFAVFDALQMNITTTYNSVALLKRILTHDGVSPERVHEAMLILDKLKKIGETGVVQELETSGISGNSVRRIIAIAQLSSNQEKVAAIHEAYGALPELTRISELLIIVTDDRLVFDPSLSRGLSYYTGVVFETYLIDSTITSSISAGGRYDKMIGDFLEKPGEYPAVGVSFGLEPITEALKIQQGELRKTLVDVYVVPIKTPLESNTIVQQLRSSGIRADIDIMERSISKNLEYASMLGISYVLIIGRQELDKHAVKLRNMNTGEESLIDQQALVDYMRKVL